MSTATFYSIYPQSSSQICGALLQGDEYTSGVPSLSQNDCQGHPSSFQANAVAAIQGTSNFAEDGVHKAPAVCEGSSTLKIYHLANGLSFFLLPCDLLIPAGAHYTCIWKNNESPRWFVQDTCFPLLSSKWSVFWDCNCFFYCCD